jgi:hypothetical protein
MKYRPRKEARKLANKEKQAELRKGRTIGAMRERAKVRKAERKRLKREQEAQAYQSKPEGSFAPRTRGLTQGQKFAERQAAYQARDDKEYAKLVAKWERKLLREGWEQDGNNSWGKDNLSIEDAIILRNKQKREEKVGFDDRAAEYLLSRGWEVGGVNNDVWSRDNWEISEGRCFRTLRRAYKLQLGLDAKKQDRQDQE